MQVLEELLGKSAVVVGLRYQGLTVKQIQEFRRSLPADTKLLVCKNTLMRVAVDKTEGWESLKPATKGDNAWLFVNEEVSSRARAGGRLAGSPGCWLGSCAATCALQCSGCYLLRAAGCSQSAAAARAALMHGQQAGRRAYRIMLCCALHTRPSV